MTKSIAAAALLLGLLAYVLPVTTAQAGCAWTSCDSQCNGEGAYIKATKRSDCIIGERALCCTADAPPPAADTGYYRGRHGSSLHDAPAAEDRKTSGVGNAATEVLHEGKQDRKPLNSAKSSLAMLPPSFAHVQRMS